MATCLESLSNGVSVTQLIKNTDYDFNVNSTTNNLFQITLDTSQTIYINVKFNSITNDTIFITIINKKTLETLRTTRVNTDTIVNTDLDNGEYYICIRTLFNNVIGKINVNYLSYPRNITIDDIYCYSGESLDYDIKLPKVEVLCTAPLKYTFISGNLPTGITLDSKGRLYGRLPIIDDENINNFPSYNLYNDKFDFVEAIGTTYEFTVKVEVIGNDNENYDIKKFCISIVNDWSLTEDYLSEDTLECPIIDELNSYVEVTNELPKSLCPPCNVIDTKINNIVYEFNDNKPTKVTVTNSDDIWTLNEFNSITKGRYISHAPFITKVSQLDYVITQYNIGYDEFIYIPSELFTDNSEYILLPNSVPLNNVYEWVVLNKHELISQGYSEIIINKYIDKDIIGTISIREDNYYLDLIYYNDIDTDPTLLYTQSRELILRHEPMFVRGTGIPIMLEAMLTYESYN